MDETAPPARESRLDAGAVLMTGAAITGAGAVVGLIAGALIAGAGGFWMFVGMGVGAVVGVCALGVVVLRSL